MRVFSGILPKSPLFFATLATTEEALGLQKDGRYPLSVSSFVIE